MNIGLITPYYPDDETINSGLANHFSTLARELSKNGHEVTVIHVRPKYNNETTNFESRLNNSITILTYKISLPAWLSKTLNKKWAVINFLVRIKCMLVILTSLNKIIKKHRLDVIETTSYFSLCYLYLLFKKQLVPIIIRVSTTFSQIMDEHYPFKSRLLNLLGEMEIAMIKKSKRRITHAHNHALELERLFDIKADTFCIIPHGINMPDFIPVAKENNDSVKILFVGRMEYRKGIHTLLAAIPLVIEQRTTVIFELVGADDNNAHQKEFLTRYNEVINQKVVFRGALNNTDTQMAYADCDIFVAPSRYESFGLIYIEAMSYGKPVIGCNVGGIPEIIEDGKNGLFSKIDDEQNLAKQILSLINNPAERKQMGNNGLETVKLKFTAEKMAANSVAYYKQSISAFS